MIFSRSSWSTVPSLSFLHWSALQFVVPAGAISNLAIVLPVSVHNRVRGSLSAASAPELTSIASPAAVQCKRDIVHSPRSTRLPRRLIVSLLNRRATCGQRYGDQRLVNCRVRYFLRSKQCVNRLLLFSRVGLACIRTRHDGY